MVPRSSANGLQKIGGRRRDVGEIDRVGAWAQPGCFGGSEGLEVADEAPQAGDLVVERAEHFGCRLVDAIEQCLGRPLQNGERCAQFVGDIGHQVAAEPVLSVEVIGHPVERLGERAQLAGAVGVDPRVASTGGEVARGGGERCDGAGDPHRDVESNDEGHCPGDEHSEDGGARECVADVAFGLHA